VLETDEKVDDEEGEDQELAESVGKEEKKS